MASSAEGAFYCANCGDEFPAPHLGTCQTCEAPGLLCEGCFKKHDRTPPLPKFREHTFVKSGHLEDRGTLIRFFELEASPEVCARHRKPLFSFCASHGSIELLCLDCAGAHIGHPMLAGLSVGAASARAALRSDGCSRLEAASDTATEVSRVAAADLELLDALRDAARERLHSTRDALVAAVTERFRLLDEELEALRETKAAAVGERKESADALCDRAAAARPHLERAASVLSDADVVVHRGALLSRARELEDAATALAGSTPPVTHLAVVFGSELDDVLAELQRLGTVAGKPGASRAAAAAAATSGSFVLRPPVRTSLR